MSEEKKIVPRTKKKLHETHNKAWCQQPSGLTAKHKPHDHNDSLFYQKMRKKKARFHAQRASPCLVLRTNGLLLETHQIRPRWPVSTTGQKLHTLSSLGRYLSHHSTKCSAVFLNIFGLFFCVMTVKMFGSSTKRTLKSKGAETQGPWLSFLYVLRTHPDRVGQEGRRCLVAGEHLAQFVHMPKQSPHGRVTCPDQGCVRQAPIDKHLRNK